MRLFSLRPSFGALDASIIVQRVLCSFALCHCGGPALLNVHRLSSNVLELPLRAGLVVDAVLAVLDADHSISSDWSVILRMRGARIRMSVTSW